MGILSLCFFSNTWIYLWKCSSTSFFTSFPDFATFPLFQIFHSSAIFFTFIILFFFGLLFFLFSSFFFCSFSSHFFLLLLLLLCHMQVHSSGNYIPMVMSPPKHTSLPSTAAILLATHLMAVLQSSGYFVFHGWDPPIQLGLPWWNYFC